MTTPRPASSPTGRFGWAPGTRHRRPDLSVPRGAPGPRRCGGGRPVNVAVSWVGLTLSLLLVVVAAGISWWQQLGLQRQILVAAARAPAQLMLVGAALPLIVSPGRSIWWSWLWVAAMLAYAATVARRRAPDVPHLLS